MDASMGLGLTFSCVCAKILASRCSNQVVSTQLTAEDDKDIFARVVTNNLLSYINVTP